MPDLISKAISGKGTVFSIGTPASTVVITANLTSGSAVLASPSSTAGILVGMSVTGTGVPALSTVISLSPITLSANATATGTAVTLTFTSAITYTSVSELKTFSFSGTKNDTVDVTNSDSAGRAHEFIVTLLDSGTIAIAGNYVGNDAGQMAVRAAFNAGTVLPYKIVLPMTASQVTNGDTLSFLALVEENDLDVQFDKEISFSIKCKISGVITYAAGS